VLCRRTPEPFRRHRTIVYTRGDALVIVRKVSRSCGKEPRALLQGAAELCGRDANHSPEDLSKMARTRVADFERDLDEAARGFADEMLCS